MKVTFPRVCRVVTPVLLLPAFAVPALAAPKKARPTAPKKPVSKAPLKPKSVVEPVSKLLIEPAAFSLSSPGAAQRLLVTAVMKDGEERDYSEQVRYTSLSPKIAAVSPDGRVTPLGDGVARILARSGSAAVETKVTVSGTGVPAEISFINDVMPVLSKAGCNGSSCHGSPAGKGGLKFSLFGYEPEVDYAALVKEADGKRVDLKAPEKSLLLQKSTLAVPHGGGQRFKTDSLEYRALLSWLKAGAAGMGDLEARVQEIRVSPGERFIGRPGQKQRLLVSATFSDATVQDVSDYALYTVNDDSVVEVDSRGIMTAKAPGETAVMVRHLGRVAVARVAVLPAWNLPKTASRPPQNSFIDRIVFSKLERLRVLPSGRSNDEEFVRRAYLDICGIIPSPDEVRAFLDDHASDKRAKLIDTLLARPDHTDLWATKWGDMLRNNPKVTSNGALPFHQWIREQVEKNVPVDQFARALLTASGRNAEEPPSTKKNKQREPKTFAEFPANPAVNYFMVAPNALDITSHTSQVFLGVRIECARCHNHPFEKWTQNDYYGLAANFSGVQMAKAGRNNLGLVQPPAAAPSAVRARRKMKAAKQNAKRTNNLVLHPKTNEPMEPRFLDGSIPPANAADPRVALAEWLTSPKNEFFARNIANRVWAHYFGRGIIEPVDDIRVTNPASNPELLDALAKELTDHNFDLRHLERVILNSEVYQLSSEQNRYNKQDTTNFAHAYLRRLSAEQLYDSISQATASFDTDGRRGRRRRPLKLDRNVTAQEPITRAAQLPTPTVQGPLGDFLTAFGRPRREITCECERSTDGNIGQALILINGDVVNSKIGDPTGRLKQALQKFPADDALVEELFLATLSRRPTAEERTDTLAALKAAATRDAGAQDVLWSLLNSREFLFNH